MYAPIFQSSEGIIFISIFSGGAQALHTDHSGHIGQ
jgi:hypothetical protein